MMQVDGIDVKIQVLLPAAWALLHSASSLHLPPLCQPLAINTMPFFFFFTSHSALTSRADEDGGQSFKTN